MFRHKRKMKVVKFLILIGSLIFITAGFHSFGDKQESEPIAYVNGEEISVSEFNLLFKRNRAMVFSEFNSMYNVSQDDDFWHNNYNGKIPIMVAKKLTFEALTKIKIEQQLMKENGIIDNLSYSSFIQELKSENKRRHEALKNNQVIYGPKQYKEDAYFDYLHNNRRIKLKEALSKTIFNTTEEALKTYYEESKDKYSDYKKADYISTECIKVVYGRNGNLIISKKDALQRINTAKKELQESKFEKVMAEYNEDNEPIKIIFDEKTIRRNMKYEYQLYLPISKLNKGEISEVIDFNGAYYIVKCIEKINGGYGSFEDYYDIIKSRYIEEVYAEYLSVLIKNATVEINSNVYEEFE